MVRLLLLGAACLAGGATASGCVSPNIREVPHVTRELVAERPAGVAVASMELAGAQLTLGLERVQELTWAETRSVERIANFHYRSLAYATFTAPEHPLARVLIFPFAAAGAVVDVFAWGISAPFAYISGAAASRDTPPTTTQVVERIREPVPTGAVVIATASAGLDVRPQRRVVDATGVARVDLDALATAAISAGQTVAELRLELDGRTGAVTIPLTLAQLLDVVAVRAERDPELRAWHWRRLHEACPPAAEGVRAAILERLGDRG